MTTMSIPRLPLPQPHIRCDYLAEPSLLFCGGREHVSARIGIATFGPRSLDMLQRHPDITRVGIIGSGRSQESAYQWVMSCLPGVEGDSEHDAFPAILHTEDFIPPSDLATVERNDHSKRSACSRPTTFTEGSLYHRARSRLRQATEPRSPGLPARLCDPGAPR